LATVKLADIIDVEIYEGIAPENNPQSLAFFESGVVVNSDEMNRLAVAEAELVNLPFWRDLDIGSEPNYSSDADTRSTPDKIVQGRMKAKRASLNKSWAARDLTNEMTMGADAMTRIKERTSFYWMNQLQDRIVAMITGIYKANIIAGNAGVDAGFGVTNDMVTDISIDTGVGTLVNFFDSSVFTTARFTMGESVDDLRAILVHPNVRKRMQLNDEIDTIQDSKLEKTIEVYQGHRLITSDKSPVFPTTTGGGLRYITTLFGRAAIAYGSGRPTTPVEMFRDPSIGDGGGEDILYERKTWLIHPFGHSNLNVTNSAAGGLWQNLADLRLGTNWKRNFFRRNAPIAFIITNG
jgi:hypothetical protein